MNSAAKSPPDSTSDDKASGMSGANPNRPLGWESLPGCTDFAGYAGTAGRIDGPYRPFEPQRNDFSL
jgi:hypothetical protein